jgi:zinc protease
MTDLDSSLKKLGIRQVGPEEMGVSEYSLSNGLKILLAPNHSAPVVTFMQLFRVGSRNEGVGHTGATHFLEHMMFKGTRKFDPLRGLDATELFNRIGAVSNATTWFDRTNYFEAVSSEYLEFCIKVEADRMRNLRLRQRDRDAEMSVVRNELERGENSPDEAMEKELYAIAYREHPYHHPTIGWRSDVEQMPMSRLRAFYDTFYWPENCTVLVVGDFEPGKVLRLLHKYYGRIGRAAGAIPQVYTEEPPQEGERRYQLSRAGDLARVWIAHRTPGSRHADHYALNVISHVLGGSHDKGSRLYGALIDSGLAMDAACRHDELRDPALMIVAATLTPAGDPARVEEVILSELARLSEEPLSDEELAPIKSANRKGSILARADQLELAFALGEAEARADWRWLAGFDALFEAVTPAEIMRVAGLYFQKDNRTVGIFVPAQGASEVVSRQGSEPEAEAEAEPESPETRPARPLAVPKLSVSEYERVLCPARRTDRAKFSSRVQKEKLDNGLTFMHMPVPGTGSVAVCLNLPAGNYYEPREKQGLSDVVAEMLLRGSDGLSKEQLAQIFKEMGLLEGPHVNADSYAVNTGATIVSEDLERYLQTLCLVLRRPLFEGAELEKLKLEWSARITEQKNNTGPVALNRLYHELYPHGHLFHHNDFDEQLSGLNALAREDLQAFHAVYSPAEAIITVAGDVEFAEALKFVRASFADWRGERPGDVTIEPVYPPEAARRIEIPMLDKSSMDILLGHPISIRRADPEFYALSLANLALGGDTIISRLGKVLREEHGLTYGIYSGLGDNAHGWAPWTVSLSVNPDNASRALCLVADVLGDYCSRGISREELKREASGAAGLFTVSMRSSIAIARVLTRFEALGLGIETVDEYPSRILAVKKSEVDEVIRKHLHPERLLTVMAGSF